MNEPHLGKSPVAKTGMLIRKPVVDVFTAFVDPATTTKFWFTKSSGHLSAGKQIRWEWEMFGAATNVLVKYLEPNKRIVIEWDGYSGRTNLEWKFASLGPDATFVSVAESGWTGDAGALAQYVSNSVQGFAWMLAGLKAWLEHGIRLNLVADRYPKGPQEPFPDQ